MTDNQDGPARDLNAEKMMENETVTNDAVAGETVLPGVADDNLAATGGSVLEEEPDLNAHDRHEDPEDIDLRTEE
jgi:hypothetical protein